MEKINHNGILPMILVILDGWGLSDAKKGNAIKLAKKMKSIIPTRSMVKSLYDQAQRVTMPTQNQYDPKRSDYTGPSGDIGIYTKKLNDTLKKMGVKAGTPIVHSKEFFVD